MDRRTFFSHVFKVVAGFVAIQRLHLPKCEKLPVYPQTTSPMGRLVELSQPFNFVIDPTDVPQLALCNRWRNPYSGYDE